MGFLSTLLGQRQLDRLRRISKKRTQTQRMKFSRLRTLEPLEERHLLAVLYWDPNHSGGVNLGGTGSWLGSNNWWNGTSNVSWTSGDDARFDVSGSGSAGTVTIGSATSAASVQFLAAGYTLNSSALTLAGTGSAITAGQSATINSSIVIGAGQDWAIASGKTLTVAGVVSGSGALALSGSGTLLVSAANTYSGGTAIANGTLKLGISNAMPLDTVVSFGASSTDGTLELNGFNQQVGGLVVASGATAANQVIGNSSGSSDSVLIYNDGGGTSSSFGGTIKDKVTGSNTYKTSVVITAGALTLTGSNTFTGGTTIGADVPQWASSAIAWSSQYSGGGWSAAQATGTPNVNSYSDNGSAWAPSPSNGTTEKLTLGYATPLYANGVIVRESWGNGFVTQIETRNASNGTFETVWSGTDSSSPGSVVNAQFSFSQRSYAVDAVRITVDTNHNLGTWEEVDAMALLGSPTATNVGATLNLSGGTNRLATTAAITLAGGTLDLGGNSQTTSGAVSFQGGTVQNGTLTKSGSAFDAQSGTISAVLNGSVGLTKSTTGTLTLSGTNTYSGGTTINGGTVAFSSGGLGTSGSITIGGDATVQWNSSNTDDISGRLFVNASVTATLNTGANNVTFASSCSNYGSVTKTGSGTLTLTNTFSSVFGTATISAGTVQVGTGGTAGQLGFPIVNNAALVFDRSDTFEAGSLISGSGTVTQIGSGTLQITNTSNSYSGGTNLSAGTLQFKSGSLSSSGNISFNGNSKLQWWPSSSGGNTQDISSRLAIGSSIAATLDTNGNNITLASGFGGSNSGSVIKVGSGALTLAAANSYTGSTTINAGSLALTYANAIVGGMTVGDGTSVSYVSGGLGTTGNITLNGHSTLQWGSGNTDDISGRLVPASGAVVTLNQGSNNVTFATGFGGTSTAQIIKTGSGTWTLSGTNTYTGGTTINGGAVVFASGGLGTSGSIDVRGNATVQWSSGNTDDISGRLFVDVDVTATLNIGANNVTFASSSFNYGSVTKTGSGTLTLANTFSSVWGTATISAGTVQVGAGGTSGALSFPSIVNNASLVFNRSNQIEVSSLISGTGVVMQSGAGTLLLSNGDNSYSGGTTIQSGTIEFVDGGLSDSGNITFSGNSKLQWYHFVSAGNTEDVSSRLIINNGITATLDTFNNDVMLASAFGGSGSGSVVKTGDGTLTFGASNTYTGSTVINGGAAVYEAAETLTSTHTLTASNGVHVTFQDGLAFSSGGTLTVNDSSYVYFLDDTSVTGTGQIVLTNASAKLYSQGINSSTPATLTIGSGVTIRGLGTLTGYYSGDDLINDGEIRAVGGTLTIDMSFTNTGTFAATGSGVLAQDGHLLHGSSSAVSGTELLVHWGDLDSGAVSYAVQESDDGGASYSTTGTVTSSDATFLLGALKRNSSHNQRLVATYSNGSKQIYDSGAKSTLDLPDTSGWYVVNEPVLQNDPVGYPDPPTGWNRGPVFAGSAAGAVMRAFGSMVKDGTVPTPGPDGKMSIYEPDFSHPRDYTYASTSPEFAISVPIRWILRTLGLGGAPNSGKSKDPIRYSDGAVDYSTVDLQSNGLGESFTQTRSWTGATQWSATQHNGIGWVDNSLPTIQESNGGETISIIRGSQAIETFELSDGQYVPTSYSPDTLVHDTDSHEFVWADSQGNVIHFNDSHGSIATGRRDSFKSMTDPNGLLTYVSAWSTDGAIGEVRRQDADSNDTESWLYSYLGLSDPNAGQLSSVQFRQSDGSSGWTLVRQVAYEYYDGTTSSGNLGDLESATTEDSDDNPLSTEYYRYYTPGETGGFVHGLKYVFDDESYARLVAAVGDLTIASDVDVAPYAQQHFEYDQFHRTTRHDIQGMGGSGTGGIGTFTYEYVTNSVFSSDTNVWVYKTTETLPDGNQNIVYSNSQGAIILNDFEDLDDAANPALSEKQWLTYYVYDFLGRVIEMAEPSAVTSYEINEDGDLVVTLFDTSGLIHSTEYYTSTTATDTSAGGVIGYVESITLQNGALGTPILQETRDYFVKTSGGSTSVVLANNTVYEDTGGLYDQTTSDVYTYFSGTVAVQSDSTTDASGATTVTFYDEYRRPVWYKDAAGFLNYAVYDQATGALVKAILDVDTSRTSDFTNLPTGWTMPTDGGLHLVTAYEVDGLGRNTKVTDANGNIAYTVYDDVNYETRVYPGWNSATNTTTGPTIVVRDDRAGNYTETFTMTAAPAVSGGRPTGAEAISGLQSLNRTLYNDAGQVSEKRNYSDLSGLTYSTSLALGTLGTNYIRTLIDYDTLGTNARMVRGDGEIYRTVYDSLGRPASEWIGTNDTPTTGTWSPTNSAGMTSIKTYAYDGNDVGDSLLTSVTDALSRVMTYGYDFRGRQTSQTLPDPDGAGVLTSPVYQTSYDNLNRVISQTDPLTNVTSYAYNATARTVTRTLPDPDGAGSLTSPVSVDTYDARGLLVSHSDALSQITSFNYDGAGRQTKVTQPDPDGAGPLAAPIIQFGYDSVGNRTSVTDPLGHVTSYTYDKADRQTSMTQPDPDGVGSLSPPVTSYGYDSAGHLETLTDPDTNVTTWEYDALGRTTSETNELIKTRSFQYDGANRLTQKTDRLGRITQYTYNTLDEVTAEKWYDGATLVRTISSTYNDAGELTQVTDPAATYGYSYDDDGRVMYESQSFAGFSPLIEYNRSFNAGASLTGLAAVVGGTADFNNSYSYDNLQRLTSVNQQQVTGGNKVAEKRSDWTYDARSQVTKLATFADAASTELVANSFSSYDNIGRLLQLTHTTDTTAPSSGFGTGALAGYQFTYDTAGRLMSINSFADGSTSYTLDNTNQLTAADHTGQTDEAYLYDANGNRTMSGYTIGSNNQLSSDGTYNYTYDDEGNRFTKTTIATGAKEEYTGDWRNRLTGVTFKDGSGNIVKTVDYVYDAFNQLVKRTVDSDGAGPTAASSTFYSNEGGQVNLQFDGSAASNLSHRYLWGAVVDQLLADEAVSGLTSPGSVQYPLADHLGTLRDLATHNSTTHATAIANHRRYDDYGNLVSETNAAVDQLFGYTGKMFDEATGLQNNLNRWYDAAIGQWVSEDPIGFSSSDTNIRRYVGNQPMSSVDPTGLVTGFSTEYLENAIMMGRMAKLGYEGQDARSLEGEGWSLLSIHSNPDIGFRAVSFQNQNTGEVVLSFAGTDDLRDVKSDAVQAFGLAEKQYPTAIKLAKEYKCKYGSKLHLVGHSLGGGLAAAAAMLLKLRATTFNAAGVNPLTILGNGGSLSDYWNNKNYIDAFRVRGEPLSSEQIGWDIPGLVMPDGNGRAYWVNGNNAGGWLGTHGMDSVLSGMRELLWQTK